MDCCLILKKYALITAVPMCFVGVTTAIDHQTRSGIYRLPGFGPYDDLYRGRSSRRIQCCATLDRGAERCSRAAGGLRSPATVAGEVKMGCC
jgi:hypothetical protein